MRTATRRSDKVENWRRRRRQRRLTGPQRQSSRSKRPAKETAAASKAPESTLVSWPASLCDYEDGESRSLTRSIGFAAPPHTDYFGTLVTVPLSRICSVYNIAMYVCIHRRKRNGGVRKGGSCGTRHHWPWIVYFSRTTSGLNSCTRKRRSAPGAERKAFDDRGSPPTARPGRCLVPASWTGSTSRVSGGRRSGNEHTRQARTLVPVVPAALDDLARVRLCGRHKARNGQPRRVLERTSLPASRRRKGSSRREVRLHALHPFRPPRHASTECRRVRQS